MWKNNIKVAIRNIKKHRIFSLINIFGLAVSMSVCLLIIMLIKDAYRFDKFHDEAQQTYRIITDAFRKGGGSETYATTPFPVGRTLLNEYSYADAWIPLVSRTSGEFQFGDKTLSVNGLMTNSDFFNVFGFTLQSGKAQNVLNNPFQVVLTPSTAVRFFGEADPIGKIIEHRTLGNFTVVGVLNEFPGKTHLEFDLLASLSTLSTLERNHPELSKVEENWNNYYMTYNFVRLNDNANVDQVEIALAQIAEEYYEGVVLETRDESYRFRLQRLDEITPGPFMSNNMGRGLPEFLLWFLMALGFIVMISACFNYTNLTVARSIVRAKEVGIRKTIGAKPSFIFFQFLIESILTSLFALLIALVLVRLTIPLFNQLQFLEFTDVSIVMDVPTIIWFLGFAIVVGIIAGLLPALVFSKFKPLTIMKRVNEVAVFKRFGLRKVLVISQFTISLIFLILLTITWKQVHFAIQGNFGFLNHTMINLDLQNESYQKVSAEVEQLSEVSEISAISHLMGTFADSKVDVRAQRSDDKVPVRDYFIDHRYLDNLDIVLVAGEDFPPTLHQDHEKFAIVNQKFLNQFQLGTASEAIGKTILIEDSLQLMIRGVTEDFLYKPLTNELEPLLLRYNPEGWNFLNIQLQQSDLKGAVVALEKTWKKINSSKTIEYSFYHDSVRENFANLFDILWIVAYFGLLGILIASLGLLGMAIYLVEIKAKEVSIRKVVGASSVQLIKLLSKGFVWILLIACIVGIPLSLLLAQQLLQIFAFRIPIGMSVIIPGVVLLLFFGISTIGSQALRAVRSNPINYLHDD